MWLLGRTGKFTLAMGLACLALFAANLINAQPFPPIRPESSYRLLPGDLTTSLHD